MWKGNKAIWLAGSQVSHRTKAAPYHVSQKTNTSTSNNSTILPTFNNVRNQTLTTQHQKCKIHRSNLFLKIKLRKVKVIVHFGPLLTSTTHDSYSHSDKLWNIKCALLYKTNLTTVFYPPTLTPSLRHQLDSRSLAKSKAEDCYFWRVCAWVTLAVYLNLLCWSAQQIEGDVQCLCVWVCLCGPMGGWLKWKCEAKVCWSVTLDLSAENVRHEMQNHRPENKMWQTAIRKSSHEVKIKCLWNIKVKIINKETKTIW